MATDVQSAASKTHAVERAHSKIRINDANGFMELVMNSREHGNYPRALCSMADNGGGNA